MESKQIKHFMYCPFTGLGLYDGFRGDTWLKNRIQIFKQFVIPSLTAQTNHNFILWISWRKEERANPIVKEFIDELKYVPGSLYKIVHTFSRVCFYDDKYPDEIARERLRKAINGSMYELYDMVKDCEYVLMTIQPSDDLYHSGMVQEVQNIFNENPSVEAIGYQKGYICNYNIKEVAEYNPTTNPPFYTIKFIPEKFVSPAAHLEFTAMKRAQGKYLEGTPLPSHEYVEDVFLDKYIKLDSRGFLVGTHGVNISTTYTNPYKGEKVDGEILKDFGIYYVEPLKIKLGIGKKIVLKMPYKVQRKLRYITYEWKFLKLSTWPGLIK